MGKCVGIGLFFLWISMGYADDFFSPPDLDPGPPPWVQDNPPDADAPPPPPGADMGPPPGFWGDEDEFESDDSDGFGFSPSPSSRDSKPKDSFQLIEPWDDVLGEDKKRKSCLGWGHPFLGVIMYQDQRSCSFGLSQKIEVAKQSIRSLEDQTRGLVLREVIAGKVTRDQSKNFKLQYDLIFDALQTANQQGCRCLE